MARKSRRSNSSILDKEQHESHTWRAALYVRLSLEDFRYKKTSESLASQQYMLEQYTTGLPDMKIHGLYSDNGETGVVFTRPAFSRMLTDIRAGLVNCVLVKDLSRFGRNYIETGAYLEEIFPALGVRFISVADMYDTQTPDSSNSGLVVALKNIVHDAYARDISAKIRSTLSVKQQKGDFIGSFPIYGYIKNPSVKNHLIINPHAAEVVADIFNWKLQGLSDAGISQRLNENSIPSPGRCLYKTGVMKREDLKHSIWTTSAVARILKCRTYLGHMEQGKSMSPVLGEKKSVHLPESEWIIVEYTHQPIIDKASFDAVQALRTIRRQRNES